MSSKQDHDPRGVDALELDREYWCFISYRHADNKSPGRQWATWLHQALETYEVPNDLVGQKNARGHIIPERIFPVFRDEEELPVDAELSHAIERALQKSRFLVVLCSPQAVLSKFVGDEIRRFKKIEKDRKKELEDQLIQSADEEPKGDDNILAVIIEGEPNAKNKSNQPNPETECFPLALRYCCDAEGELTSVETEPIAADMRLPDGSPGWTGPAPYRAALQLQKLPSREIEALVTAYSNHSRTMFLKIVAGILGIPLRMLTQREQAYQLAKQKQKARILRRWLSLVALLALFAVVAAFYANNRRDVANQATQTALDLANRNLDLAVQKDGALKQAESEYRRAETERGIAENRRVNLEKFTHLSMQLSIQRGTTLPASVGSLWLVRGLELARPEDQPYAEAIRYALMARSSFGDLSLGTLRHPNRVRSVSLNADGHEVTSVCDDGVVREWATLGDGLVRSETTFDGWPDAASVTSQKLLVLGNADRGANLRRLADTEGQSRPLPHTAFVELVGSDPTENTILTAGWDHKVRLWSTKPATSWSQELEQTADVSCFCFSPNGQQLLTGCWDGTTRLWNVVTGELVGDSTHHRQAVSAVAFSADGKYCLSASRGGWLMAINASDGTTIDEPFYHTRAVTQLQVHPDGKLIASNGEDKEVLLLRLENRLEVHQKLSLESDCTALAFSPDGKLLATGLRNGTVQFWHVETGVLVYSSQSGAPLGDFEPESNEVSDITFSADGSRVASINGNEVSLWMTPIAVKGETPAIVRAIQSVAGGVLANDGSVRAAGELEMPTPDEPLNDPFRDFREQLQAEFLGTIIANTPVPKKQNAMTTISPIDGDLLRSPTIREILSEHVAALRDLAKLARELTAADAPVVSNSELAAVEFDLAIAESCLAFTEGDSKQIDVAFQRATDQGRIVQAILKESFELGVSDLIPYQQSVLRTMLVQRTHLHALHWREGSDNRQVGIVPNLSRFQMIVAGVSSQQNTTLTPDDLLLLREQVAIRETAHNITMLREAAGVRGGTVHEVEAAGFLLDVEQANIAAAQRKSTEPLALLAKANGRLEPLMNNLRAVQPFDGKLLDLLPRQDAKRLFAHNLRWMIISGTNTRLMAEYLKETKQTEDFASDVLAPHLIMCDWIIRHNYVNEAVAGQITRDEVKILKQTEQSLKANLDTARMIRDVKSGFYTNIDIGNHAVPLVWLEAQREFATGNYRQAIQALTTGAELSGGQRKLIQLRIDAGLALPHDADHIRISLEELSFRKSVSRLRRFVHHIDESQGSEDIP